MSNCVLWAGSTANGYGRMSGGALAHREAYKEATGENIEGLDLHHLCGTPLCVSPEHLLPIEKGKHSKLHIELRRATNTSCVNGHSWDENEGWQSSGDGYSNRYCKECARIKARKNRAENYIPHPAPTPTHCPQGHGYTTQNAVRYTRPNGKTKLSCRECNRLRASINRKSAVLDPIEKARRKDERAVAAVESREATTHCKRGHEWTDESRYVAPNGTWTCRTCKNDAKREKRSKG